ncbi:MULTISPECIES: IclR family transcriptional regulator [Paenibacillus]|uniref:IclR family transcriptional regulator n=1 Tax=Paenibacillus pabuli TaxID=1472 RepID=A0A855YB88_9BACL|nr:MULTISPECIES: IclR family transcriptional regulator [Paenibacillus]PWW38865.1 IclR family transcriptional regulator [Paenibacillus pabuli]PXW06050.1 IclR family transcriptional regulator [Paenibacillus taichungensis]
MESYELTTLKRGLVILDLLRERHSLSLSQIMKELSLNKTTVYKMLYTLEKMEYIKKIEKYYYLNSRIFFDNRIHIIHDIQWTSLNTPFRFAQVSGEKEFVGVLENEELVIKNVISTPSMIPDLDAIGNRSPIYSSAIGKAVLANLPSDLQAEILKNLSLSNITRKTFNDKDLLKHHLQVIKDQGYAVDDEETNVGKRCVAAPVYVNGLVVGSLAIHGDTDSIRRKSIRSLSNMVMRYSRQLSLELEHLKSS